METFHWWKLPREHKISRKKTSEALLELESRGSGEIYRRDPEPARNADELVSGKGSKATVGGFLKAFGKDVLATSIIAAICIVALVKLSADIALLGAYIILYDGLLFTGIGVCLGLQIKWVRDYRAAGGQVFTSDDLDES